MFIFDSCLILGIAMGLTKTCLFTFISPQDWRDRIDVGPAVTQDSRTADFPGKLQTMSALVVQQHLEQITWGEQVTPPFISVIRE